MSKVSINVVFFSPNYISYVMFHLIFVILYLGRSTSKFRLVFSGYL